MAYLSDKGGDKTMKKCSISNLLLAGAWLLAISSCTEFNPVPDNASESADGKETRIEVLGLKTEAGTKVTLGEKDFAWRAGDKIAVWTGMDASHGSYQECTVASDLSLPVTLEEGKSRFNYAIYPASMRYDNQYSSTNLMIKLPDSYAYDDVCGDNVQAPMIAVNDNSSKELVFYNIASMLRLKITLPKRTVKLKLKFHPDSTVNGAYYVKPYPVAVGTSCVSSSSYSHNRSNVVYITGVHDIPADDSTITVNIPIPVGKGYNDFSISAWDSDNKALRAEVIHFASDYEATRAHGKKITTALTQGAFVVTNNKYCIFSPANLMYDGTKLAFHEHEYDICAELPNESDYTSSAVFDLFEWGTSGYNGSNPWGSYTIGADDLQKCDYGWGRYNEISSYKNKTWLTPSKSDLDSILKHKIVSGKIAGTHGLIVLPRDYSGPELVDKRYSNFSCNNFTAEEWAPIKKAGAVFLPLKKQPTFWQYWASNFRDTYNAYGLKVKTDGYGETIYFTFTTGYSGTTQTAGDYCGKSSHLLVRLIHFL